MTFSEKADAFWQWFVENEPVLAQMADHPALYDPQHVIAFVDQGVSLLSSQLQYTMGGHREFTFAAEGKEVLFYLLPYLVSRKPPVLDSWTFRPLLPGQGSFSFDFSMFGLSFSSGDVQISMGFEPSAGTFRLSFYHPQLCSLEQPNSLSAFYQLLDLTLGESMSYIYIADAQPLSQPEEGMFPLTALKDRLLEAMDALGLPPIQRPDEQSVPYGFHPQENLLPRFDVIQGSTCYTGLVNDYYAGRTENLEGLREYGANACYLSFAPEEYLGTEEADAIRYQLEQQIQQALGPRGSGQEKGIVLGGATGMEHCYIDLLLYHPPALDSCLRPLLLDSSYNFSFADFRLLAPVLPISLPPRLS